jgi:hypothetical protein
MWVIPVRIAASTPALHDIRFPADDLLVFKSGWWRQDDIPQPPRWQVLLLGAFAPSADPRWRRQRLLAAAALLVFGLVVWGVGNLILWLA